MYALKMKHDANTILTQILVLPTSTSITMTHISITIHIHSIFYANIDTNLKHLYCSFLIRIRIQIKTKTNSNTNIHTQMHSKSNSNANKHLHYVAIHPRMDCWVGMHYNFNLSPSLSIGVSDRVSIRFMIIIKMSIGLMPPILAAAWLRLKSVRADG